MNLEPDSTKASTSLTPLKQVAARGSTAPLAAFSDRLAGDGAGTRTLALLATTLLGTLVLAASARVQVPFYPVPMTMQVGAVLLLSATAGARLAAAMVALYLVQGLVGLPVFASAVGPAALLGPTGGYLIGFLVAAVAVGAAFERGAGKSLVRALAWMLLGAAVIYACGYVRLAIFIGVENGGFEKAFFAGVVPFVLGDLLKATLAAFLARACFRRWQAQS